MAAVLAHDLYQKSVALSINAYIPEALKMSGMKVQSIATCLGLTPSQNYFETSAQSIPSSFKPVNEKENPNYVNSGSNKVLGSKLNLQQLAPQSQHSATNTTKISANSTSMSPYSGPHTAHWRMYMIFCELSILMLLGVQFF